MRNILKLLISISTVSSQEILTNNEEEPTAAQNTNDMYFRFGSSNIPHFQKRYKGGEDAWLAQEDLLVVADGVGGWEEHGIDSGRFSK